MSFIIILGDGEAKYWENEVSPEVYQGEIDTTFAIVKVGQPFFYPALRVAGDCTSIHKPWYLDWNKLDPEEQYYIDHCTPVSTYKRVYDQWKLTKMNAI